MLNSILYLAFVNNLIFQKTEIYLYVFNISLSIYNKNSSWSFPYSSSFHSELHSNSYYNSLDDARILVVYRLHAEERRRIL